MQLSMIQKKLHNLPPGLRHCGIYTLLFVIVVLTILITHLDSVYGARVDWSSQHYAIPEYFRTRFYATGNLFPNLALHLGSGQNIYNLGYYGLYNPVILLSYCFPWVTMATYLQITSCILTLISVYLCYFWLRRWFTPRIAFVAGLLFLCSAPIIFHTHHHLMFTNYFSFLFWGFFAVHRALERRHSISLLVAAVLMLLSSFFFSVGAFFALMLYAVFVILYQHHVHTIRQLLRGLGIMAIHLVLAALIAAFFLLPVAYTLLHGRDVSSDTSSFWEMLLPGAHLRYITYSPFSMGVTTFGILAPLVMLRNGLRPTRFLSIVFFLFIGFPIVLYLFNGTMYLDPKALIPFLPLMILLYGFFFQRFAMGSIQWLPAVPLYLVLLILGFLSHDGVVQERIGLLVDGVIMCVALCMFLLRKQRRFLMVPIIGLALFQCFSVNIGDGYMKKADMDVMYSEDIQSLVDTVTESDASFYRIAHECKSHMTVNRIWGPNCYRTTLYSSVHTSTFSDFYFRQAYNENSIRNAAMIVQSKNPIYGMMMGEKYIIAEEPLHRYGLRLVDQVGDSLLYENTLSMPIGFATTHVMAEETMKGLSYPDKLSAMLENAIVRRADIPEAYQNTEKLPEGTQKLEMSDLLSGYTPQQITNIYVGYYVHSQEEFTVTVPLDEPVQDLLLMQMRVNNRLGDGSTTGDVSITVNGVCNKLTDPAWKYQNHNNIFRYSLSSDEPIQTLTIQFSAGDYIISDMALYSIPYETLNAASQQVTPLVVNYSDIGDDTITGAITVAEDSWFVMSIPYDEGFALEIDGKATPIVRTDADLIGCPISAGSHQIRLTYTAPCSILGAKCTMVGIGGAGLWFGANLMITWHRRRKKALEPTG